MVATTQSSIDEIIYINGLNYFNALIEDINQAKSIIILETYIFCSDNLGNRLIQALAAAVQRNIKVMVLIDGIGTRYWINEVTLKLEQAGAEVRVFHPFPWQLWHWSRSVLHIPFVLRWLYLFLKINSRNHRKVCIIDECIAYIGSFNVSQCHLDKESGGDNWRDTGVKIHSNQKLADLIEAFDASWNHTPIPERIRQIFKHVSTNPIFRLNNGRHRRRILYKNLLQRINKCKTCIWITNAYFVPDNFLLRKLKDSARKGIDVRILLPHESDVIMMPWASMAFYQNLLHAGVRIFEYIPSMLHAKTIILDDWVSIGSSNLNHRSLLHDLEVDVNLRSEQSIQLLKQQFLTDLNNANEINLLNWYHRPLYQRVIGKLFLYLKYWM